MHMRIKTSETAEMSVCDIIVEVSWGSVLVPVGRQFLLHHLLDCMRSITH